MLVPDGFSALSGSRPCLRPLPIGSVRGLSDPWEASLVGTSRQAFADSRSSAESGFPSLLPLLPGQL